MKNKFSVQHKLFYTQMILNSIVIFAFSLYHNQAQIKFLVLFNILGLLISKKSRLSIFERLNQIIQIFAQAVLIPSSISYLIILTSKLFSWNNPFLIGIIILYSLIMFIPYTHLLIVPIKTITMRIIVLILMFVYTASSALDEMVASTSLSANWLIQALSNSIFDGAIITLIIILITMRSWNFDFPKYRFNVQAKKLVTVVLILFTTWFAFWNAFPGGNNFLSSLFVFSFSNIHPTLTNILSGLEAGIAEEFLFRYAILTLLLRSLYNSRNKFIYAALISSFLFGLLHGMNTLSGQSIANTALQILFAFSFGLYLAGIYLYTDQFYLTVFFHALIDSLVFLTSSNQIMTGKVTTGVIVGTVFESMIFIILGLLLTLSVNQRKQNFDFQLFK